MFNFDAFQIRFEILLHIIIRYVIDWKKIIFRKREKRSLMCFVFVLNRGFCREIFVSRVFQEAFKKYLGAPKIFSQKVKWIVASFEIEGPISRIHSSFHVVTKKAARSRLINGFTGYSVVVRFAAFVGVCCSDFLLTGWILADHWNRPQACIWVNLNFQYFNQIF